jgi:cold shock CspA family protein
MEVSLQIAFRNLAGSAAIEEAVRKQALKLERFSEHVTGCRVVIEVPHRHHESGNLYLVRIDLTVPGEELVVNRVPPERAEYRQFDVALHDAFDKAARVLEDYERRRRRDVKAHEHPPHARVRVVLPGQDHGFLETPDGRQVYFHRHSLVNADFDTLRPGTEVTFVEGQGEQGPQASTVRVVGRHGHV